MLKGIYDRMITKIAGQQTITRPDIPGAELGIDMAEMLNPIIHPYTLPKFLPSQYMNFDNPSNKTIDDIGLVGRGPIVDKDDFSYSGYAGEAL